LEIASPGGLQRKITEANDVLKGKDETEKAKEWKDFFSSPFVLKGYNIKARQLMFGEENYKKITGIVKAINKQPYSPKDVVVAIENSKDALLEFTKFTEDLRKAETRQAPFENGIYSHTNKETGIMVEVKMSSVVKGGAFTKCTNPSFAVKDGIEVRVYSPLQVKAAANTTHLVVDVELTKIFAYIDLIGAVTYGGNQKTENKDGKNQKDGQDPNGKKVNVARVDGGKMDEQSGETGTNGITRPEFLRATETRLETAKLPDNATVAKDNITLGSAKYNWGETTTGNPDDLGDL
jgi:hypothetical protein